MLISIDIGNSRIKTGKFKNNELTEIHSFKEIDDLIKFLKSDPINDIAVSSVVPSKTKIIFDEIKNLTRKNIFVISKEIKTNLKIEYKTPETLGIDRLCSAEGAFFLLRNSEKYKNYNTGTFILSIDFGTATTINVIGHPGKFIGGLIAPGIDMMFDSLKQKTAQLPLLSISDYTSTIGNDTKSSIASGVVTSVVGMIEKTINYLQTEKSAKEIVVYLAGGNVKKITPYLDMNFIYEEGLVLYGVNALWKLNRNG
jgi:type III pantothenate kinase